MAQRDIIEERRKRILSHIDLYGKAELSELALMLGTTEYTVRRDLIALERANLLIRTHGGAIKKEKENSVWQITSIGYRLEKNRGLKDGIAALASTLIHDNESLMIDGGSTTQIFASCLRDKRKLLAVTTSPRIAELLMETEDSQIILIGGELTKSTFMVSGADAEEHLRKYYVDKSIISVTGADPDTGCYAAIPNEASLKKLMIEHSRECILLADSSKFSRKAFCLAFSFDSVSTVVTDAHVPREAVEKLRNKGIKVLICDI